ncbi:MAG: hypothetical protein ACOX3T_00370 [Bdellovibrionota bacterium]
MANNLKEVKQTLLKALTHQEAEEGLYFRNFYNMHEADERPMVDASRKEIAQALCELIKEDKIKLSVFDDDVIFLLNK